MALDHVALTLTSQTEFTALLAKEAKDKELVFFIHGFNVQTEGMVTSTDNMQTNFDSSPQNQKGKDVLVVPVDWACTDGKTPIAFAFDYHPDQASSETAGKALWKLVSGLKKENNAHILNVIAHSMGNRVLRCVGKSAAEDSSWHTDALKEGTTLLQAAPADLKNHENLFENIFFVAADIPECVFEEPDGPHVEQAEHALQSGVAALAVMTKRMHVLHGNGTDQQLNISFAITNPGKARLGSRGPWSSKLGLEIPAPGSFLPVGEQGELTKVWDKIGDALEKYEGETDPKKNNSNVHVKDCRPWNTEASGDGHSYQFALEAVTYYREHMTKGM